MQQKLRFRVNSDDTVSLFYEDGNEWGTKESDEVVIAVPVDTELTLTEQNGEYTAHFKLDDGQEQATNTMTFTITDDAVLEVVNSLGMIVPTGIDNNIAVAVSAMLLVAAFIVGLTLRRKGMLTIPNNLGDRSKLL